MKALKLFAALTLISISFAFATPLPQIATIDVVHSKYENLFIFKVDRKLKGADVEVTYTNGDVIANIRMKKRKLIINFCDVKFGSYVIKVKKGNEIQEFQYVKK